jgi:hypothetical protein
MKNRLKLLFTAAIMTLSMSSWSQVNSIGIKGTASTKPEDSAWGIPMIKSPDNPNIFTAICTLIAGGDLKFHADRDGSYDANKWFYAPAANSPILTASTYVVGVHNIDPDNKWVVGANEGGLYKITIDTNLKTIKIEPTAPIAAIVGSATSIGYSLPGLPFTPTSDPNILSWTGNLTAGEFKINLTTGEWNDDYWLTAPAPNTSIMSGGVTIANTDATRSINNSPNDNKWVLSAAEVGQYKVEVNLTTTKITLYDSAHLGLTTSSIKEELAIYPNPVANTLFFSTELNVTNVSIYSTTGSSVSKQKVINNTLDVSNLKSGVYFVVFDKDGTKITKRFIKK